MSLSYFNLKINIRVFVVRRLHAGARQVPRAGPPCSRGWGGAAAAAAVTKQPRARAPKLPRARAPKPPRAHRRRSPSPPAASPQTTLSPSPTVSESWSYYFAKENNRNNRNNSCSLHQGAKMNNTFTIFTIIYYGFGAK